MNSTQTIAGYDNTNKKRYAVILETSPGDEYVFCQEYDWAEDVTVDQAEVLINGTITEKRAAMALITGNDVCGWYIAVRNVRDVQ